MCIYIYIVYIRRPRPNAGSRSATRASPERVAERKPESLLGGWRGGQWLAFLQPLRILGLYMAGVGPSIAGVRGPQNPTFV